MSVEPFTIKVEQAILDDLHMRLERTRWPSEIQGSGWKLGTNLQYLRELTTYWRDTFDWRAQETMLNRFAHFRATIDEFGIHFIHERGEGPNPIPLLLSHGWPDSFFRMYKIIPMLTDPAAYGGDPADAFDVVVPSLPGYGFSDRPTDPSFTGAYSGDLFLRLMTDELGYGRFGAHGGDIGSGLTEALASAHADALIGIHLTDIPYWHLFTTQQDDFSDAEKAYAEAGQQWGMQEGTYALQQSTKPQTLAYGLNDSPAGLAAWIVEKFRAWSDCNGDIESRFSKDELLTNLMLYWATETIGSSFLPYADGQNWSDDEQSDGSEGGQAEWSGGASEGGQSDWWGGAGRIEVPTGVAIFPKDIVPAPREFGERFFNIQRWTDMPRGGHFAALEEPELLAEDIRAFFRPLREASGSA